MKFGETLRYNAVPDWLPHYMAYDQCKQILDTIRTLKTRIICAGGSPTLDDERSESSDEERAQEREPHTGGFLSPSLLRSASQTVLDELERLDPESGSARQRVQSVPTLPPLEPRGYIEDALSVRELRSRLSAYEDQFFHKLDHEAEKVEDFYTRMMHLLPEHTVRHRAIVDNILGRTSDAGMPAEDGLGTSLTDRSHGREVGVRTPLLETPRRPASAPESPTPSHQRRPSISSPSTFGSDAGSAEVRTLRSRISNHYLDIVGLRSYSQLNVTAFDKILKKHDKITGQTTRAEFMRELRARCQFPNLAPAEQLKAETEALYADLALHGDVEAAKEELSAGVRDQIIWSRNTVWRDMLRNERRVSAIRAYPTKFGEPDANDVTSTISLKDRGRPLLASLFIFALVVWFPGVVRSLPVEGGREYLPATLDAAQRCLAMLAAVLVLWSQDGVPLYVTGFLVVPSTVLLKVLLDDDGSPIPAREAAETVFHAMSSSTIMLIICVYTLHAALSKYRIDKMLASEVLSRVLGAETLLLAVMCIAVLLSMLVSNVASPVLLNSIVMPVLSDMPRSSRPFVQCILLGIAVASNIGGMPSPISSPQNAVAHGLLQSTADIPFLKWLVIALPLSMLMILLAFAVLLVWFRPHRYRLPTVPRYSEKFAWPHYVILATVVMTVVLWSWPRVGVIFGSAGMVAVVPILVFYGTGILDKEDFNNLPWDVVYLVAGGVVLGEAVRSSRLLDLLSERIHHSMASSSTWASYATFTVFIAIVANMISHTVSAIIILPVINEVGTAIGHPGLFVMGGVLACSSAMSLPVSSFPNMAALSVVSDLGEPYLKSSDLLRVGLVMTVLSSGVVLTIGYVWMSILGL